MSAGDSRQRGMQPGQPGLCADCSSCSYHGVRTKCESKSWVRHHLFSKTCDRYGGADASRWGARRSRRSVCRHGNHSTSAGDWRQRDKQPGQKTQHRDCSLVKLLVC